MKPNKQLLSDITYSNLAYDYAEEARSEIAYMLRQHHADSSDLATEYKPRIMSAYCTARGYYVIIGVQPK